jgi:hypothetical protein
MKMSMRTDFGNKMLLPAAAALILLSCGSCGGSPSSAGDDGLPAPISGEFPEKGVVHWKSFLSWDEGSIAEAARSRMAIFPIQICLSDAGGEIIGRMKEINPEMKIVGYQGLLAVSELYPDSAWVRENIPYELDYYYLVRDRWAFTTTGDTLSIWPGSIFLNPLTGGTADAGMMEELVGLIERYRDGHESRLDGIMHDYFMEQPYVNPELSGVVEGDIDLDGDGIPIGDDPGERAEFLRWQIEYAALIRDRLGPDFIQVGNGRVPQDNAELAGNINGIFYELYPNMCWSITDRAGFQKLLANQADGWLAKAFGRTWSIVTNDAIEYNNYFCMISSLLTGCMYTELYGNASFTGWELELDPGLPVSELIVEGRPDSVMTYRRFFSNGEARISFASYGGRISTQFIEETR